MTSIEFPRRPVAFLAYFLKRLTLWQKLALFLIFVGSIAATISSFAILYSFKLLVDNLTTVDTADVWGALRYPFLLIILFCFAHSLSFRIRDTIDAFSVPYIQNALRELLLSNLLRHSHEYFHDRFSGELVNKLGNVNQAFSNLMWDRFINGFVPTGAAILSSLVILGGIDINLSAILLVATITLILAVRFLGHYVGNASAHLADTESAISGQVVDTITNISSVKGFASGAYEMGLLRAIQRPFVKAYQRSLLWQNIFWGVFNFATNVLIIIMIWYLIAHWSTGQYSTGDIAVCILILWDMWERLANFSYQLTLVSGDLGRMQSALNEFVVPIGVQDRDNAAELVVPHGQITFDRMGFTYQSGHRVFDDFQLVIPPAQKIGIVGLSGAGKTTLCHLLMRNYDVTSGIIAIDGQDIAGVTQDSLRRNIAVIPQDPSLFHRSLYENILYGRPEASEAEVMAAAKAAQAHDFILATPEGYNTLVGERGVKLSGGQRQRIAIARAILKDAPILILDEATSALDSDTERLIQTALDTAMQGRTTLVVAHRLSTLAHMDRLIVMQNGRIVEDGTQAELMALDGAFAHLWSLQAGGFLPHKI